jgi:hypothetical protein
MRHHVRVAETIWSIIAGIASVIVCVGVGYAILSGRNDRTREEEAREFFSRHGHWPDEGPTS